MTKKDQLSAINQKLQRIEFLLNEANGLYVLYSGRCAPLSLVPVKGEGTHG